MLCARVSPSRADRRGGVGRSFRCRGACRAKTRREAAPEDALSRDIAALMAYGREEEEENAV